MKVTFLGTGTSHGIPVVNCNCPVCTSSDPKDTRYRCSIKVESSDGTTVIVDTGPEFRLQALKYGLPHLDAVFITHSHADHIHGLDDVRIFAHIGSTPEKTTKPLSIYAGKHTNDDIRVRFDYAFKTTQIGGGKPALTLIDSEQFSVENPILLGSAQGGLEVVPVPMMHGIVHTTGWRFRERGISENGARKKSFAYLTDCNFIPETSIAIVKKCDSVVIDALREKKHETHFNFEQAMDVIKKLDGTDFYFIHLCHDFKHSEIPNKIEELREKLGMKEDPSQKDKKITDSYDGLVIEL